VVTETTVGLTFTDTDTLINCMLKMLLRKTRPSNETSMRIIHKTGIHLLKFNTLYGTHFTSCIDTTILSNILINKFDCDLLLLCGDIESNPGPRQSTNQGGTAERTSTMITDCYDIPYRIIPMTGSGFCAFHCLSYSLTGQQYRYSEIINDCIAVFTNIPDLFRLRTNFGARLHSSLNEYVSMIFHALEQVQSGSTASSDCWCEDAHLLAIALFYNITIFMYSTQSAEWYVFNESGNSGYICKTVSSPVAVSARLAQYVRARTLCLQKNSVELQHFFGTDTGAKSDFWLGGT